MIVWTLLRNSLPLQLIAVALMGWAALGANNLYQRSTGRVEGRTEVATAVKEKADANTEVATEVREAVAARKPGKPDPNRLLEHPSARGPGYGHKVGKTD